MLGATIQANSGSDSLSVAGNLKTSTVFGGSGNDTLTLDLGTSNFNSFVFADNGNDSLVIKAGTAGTTIYGDNTGTGAGADTIAITGVIDTFEVRGNGGSDSFTIATTGGVSASTLNAGVGNDTINFAEAGATTLKSSKLLTGDGNNLVLGVNTTTANITASTIVGGSGNDSFNFTGGVAATSIVGGGGNDSLTFGTSWSSATAAAPTSTYYFGFGSGQDVINFAENATGAGFVVAVSADFGNTGTYNAGTLTLGAGNTITFSGGATTSFGTATGFVSVVTVSNSTITSLG